MYELWLTLHVLAVVLWAGGGVTLHVAGRHAMASGDPQRLVDFTRETVWIGPRFYAPLSVVLVVAGSFLVGQDESGASFSDLWINLGYIGWAIAFLIAVFFYGPQGKKMEQLVQAEGLEGPNVRANAERVLMVNSIEVLVLVLVVIDMTVKPGA